MAMGYLTDQHDDDAETAARGTSMVLTDTGWEACAYVEPEDDWVACDDGSYVSPDERTRTWPGTDPT